MSACVRKRAIERTSERARERENTQSFSHYFILFLDPYLGGIRVERATLVELLDEAADGDGLADFVGGGCRGGIFLLVDNES